MTKQKPTRDDLAGKSTAEYRRTDDSHFYNVTTAAGTQIRVKGINSAKAVADDKGTFERG